MSFIPFRTIREPHFKLGSGSINQRVTFVPEACQVLSIFAHCPYSHDIVFALLFTVFNRNQLWASITLRDSSYNRISLANRWIIQLVWFVIFCPSVIEIAEENDDVSIFKTCVKIRKLRFAYRKIAYTQNVASN